MKYFDLNKPFSKLILIVFITALLGELKIEVFHSPFRFSLGSAAFLFLLLFYREVSYITVGIVTGIFTTFFRIGLDYIFLDPFYLSISTLNHIPIIGYYITFSIILHAVQCKKYIEKPLVLGFIGAISDVLANTIELIIRNEFTENTLLTPTNLSYILIIAFLRSYLVTGLFTMIYLSELKSIYQEQKNRFEQLQILFSGLYVEAFYLKKVMSEIENITAKSFRLYEELKQYPEIPSNTTEIALTVAQEVHEVKKDNQRILAGLEKLIGEENKLTKVSLQELIVLVFKANQKYAEMLGKKIEFKKNEIKDFQINHVYPILVVLNNLMTNAVEAIVNEGIIDIHITQINNCLKITIKDNGVGIKKNDKYVIFEPGFTTKYNENGESSTGIGLSHVKALVNNLGGEIEVLIEDNWTNFIVYLPIEV